MYVNRLASCLWAAAVLLAVSGPAAVNNPPTANPDTYTVNEDSTLTVSAPGVLANDTDLEGSSLTAALITAPTNGTLNFTSNGSFTYRGSTNFHGVVSFTYRARDGSSNSMPTTVTITVNPTNDAPRATNNAYSVNSDTTLSVPAPGVLGNDLDVDGDVLTPVLVSNVTRGVLVLNASGSFSYAPSAGYSGGDSFTYRASDGVTNSAIVTVSLTVIPAPIVVTRPPTNQTACVGGSVTFGISATGTALTYQWFKGTNALAGETASTLALNNVTAADAATYRVRLTGATNSITNSATLTVNIPVSTPALPNSVRMAGSIIIFDATATGTGPITYAWLRDGAVLPGQNNGTLVLTNLLTSDSGTYAVIVSGACGSVTNSATLTVAPCFNAFDVMLVIDRSGSMVGQAYADARTAASNFVHNLHLSAETNDTLGLVSYNPTATLNQTLTNSPAAMEAAIEGLGAATNGTCISCGIVTAQAELTSGRRRPEALPVLVLLTDGIPHDFDTPSNALYNAQLAKNAGTRIFTVAFGTNIDTALMQGMASSPNDYFYAANSSQIGALFDAISTVICRPPTNIFGPYDLTVCAGPEVNLRVQAEGCASFTYQWRKGGALLLGETNSTLALGAVEVEDTGVYSVVVSSACRTVTNSATLTVNAPAFFAAPPENQTSYLGSNALFSAGVTGTSLSYQWLFNGAVVGTGSTLALANLTAGQAGTYCVVAVSADCGGPVTNCATLTILNRPPTAGDDAYATLEDTTLTVPTAGVLVNDGDVDGDPISAVLVTGAAHGLASLNGDGSFLYTPDSNFHGVDSFTYRTSDGSVLSGLATVTITVTTVNDPPVAADDAHSTPEDTTLFIPAPGILANDFDADGDAISGILLSNVTHGSLVLNADGAFFYTPNANFHGEDSFLYRAFDGTAFSSAALVRITVVSTNDTPVAANDRYTIAEDSTLDASAPGILANDSDADGDVLTVALVGDVANGVLNLSANGAFTYTPSLNYTGVDTFTYVATDGAATSAVATVTITVTPVNDTPVAANDAYTTPEDTTLNVAVAGVLLNDSDVDGDALTVTVLNNVAHGSLNLSANGAFTYTPSLNYTGVDTFTYVATDGLAASAPATVTITITPVNDTPVAMDDAFSTAEDTVLAINVPGILVNDSDADGDVLTVTVMNNVAHGTLSLGADGAFTYTPSLNYTGADTFTYVATDGTASSAPATVTITITPLNDPPVAAPDEFTTWEDTALTIPGAAILGNDFDADGDALTIVLSNSVTHGTLVLNPEGAFTYTPAANFHGEDSFLYRALDGELFSAATLVRIIVIPTNDTPVAANDAYTTAEDSVLTVITPGILANDTDADGETLAAELVSNVTHGTLNLSANGAFVYTPSLNYTGADTFTYRATDGVAFSAVATVNIIVTPVNDPPVAGAGESYSVPEDQTLTVAAPGLLANDTDADGDALGAVLVSGVAHGMLALQADGSFTYTPAADYFGSDSFSYVAADGAANSAATTVTITVTPVNDAPSFVAGANQRVNFNAGAQSVPGWASGLGAGPANESAQVLRFEVANSAASLFAVAPDVSANGTLTYTPAGNLFGVATVTVVLKDDGGTAGGGSDSSGERTFTITLNGPPVISIINPTNNATYVGTNTVTVVAEAGDPDSAVTNVTIYSGTNVISSAADAPYFASLVNAPLGVYAFRAVAVDDLGLRATSSIVTVTVTQSPPVTALGPIVLNHQNGLFEQFVRISNSTPQSFPNGMRLYVTRLDSTNRVYNATGTNAGVPFIDVLLPLPSMGFLDVKVQYYVPNPRSVPSPLLIAEPLPFTVPVAGAPLLKIAQRTPTGFVVQFETAAGRLYYLQASPDCRTWTTQPGMIRGTGGPVQSDHSFSNDLRFFRVLLLP